VTKPINLKIKRKISLMSVSVECTKKEVIRSVSIRVECPLVRRLDVSLLI